MKQQISKLYELVLKPFSEFVNESKNFYINYINDFKEIVKNIIELKKNTNLAYNSYRESANELIKFKEKADVSNEESLEMLEIQSKYSTCEENYISQISQQNKFIDIFNKKYVEMTNNFMDKEKNKNSLIQYTVEKASIYLENIIEVEKELLAKLKDISNNYFLNTDNEIEKLNNYFEKNKKLGERFQKEETKSFMNYTGQNNTKTDSEYLNSKKNNINTANCIRRKSRKYNELDFFINSFIHSLFSKKEFDVATLTKIMDFIHKDQTFNQKFIEYFITSKDTPFYIFENIANLQCLSNIFHTISSNSSKRVGDSFDTNYSIINISEKTYCNYNNEKIYLCSILSQCKFYNSKTFWAKLIQFKLVRILDERIKTLKSIQSKQRQSNLFSNMKNVFKGVFNEKNTNQNKENEEKVKPIVEVNEIYKCIKDYDKLTDNDKHYLDEFTTNELENILKEFIKHLCNFNFSPELATEIIIGIAKKFLSTQEKIDFYISSIGTWVNSIKRKLPEDKHDAKTKRKIYEIKVQKIQGQTKNDANEKCNILISASKFLPLNEIPKILAVSKFMSVKGKKKIYEDFLSRDKLTINDRLNIWKSLLLVSNIKKKYNYNEIKNDKTYIEKITKEVLDQIKLDITRTVFKDDGEKNKERLKNILNIIAYLKPKLNYCQGMSYIGSFLLQLTLDEEETFYLMISIFETTEFIQIFIENLEKLKTFFYDFDKLISVYAPEVEYIIKINNIDVNCFCASWFLTLFSYSCQIVDIEHIPRILLQIWDAFFLQGWKALLTTGLVIMKTNEEKLKAMKNVEILKYLINDVLKGEFFEEDFYKRYMKFYKRFYIKKKLIKYLDKQYEHKSKNNN